MGDDRGAPQPERLLTRHIVLRTSDVEVLHAYIAGMDGRHQRRVEAVEPGSVAIELRHARLGRVDVGLSFFSIPMTVESARPRSSPFLVQFPLTGSFTVEVAGRTVSVAPGAGAVLSPGQRVRRATEPGWTLLFSVAGDLVRSRLEDRLGHVVAGPVVFDPRIPPAPAAQIRAYGLLVVEAIDQGSVAEGDSLAAVLEEGLVDLLLTLQPHTLSGPLAESQATARASRVRLVADFIDGHLAEPLTVERLAEAAGCGVRVLQETLAHLCGMSPLEFVRRRRLAAARKLLEAGDPKGSVTRVAQRCGFTQLGRFAASYKNAYGESPSDTLQRVARRSLNTVD